MSAPSGIAPATAENALQKDDKRWCRPTRASRLRMASQLRPFGIILLSDRGGELIPRIRDLAQTVPVGGHGA